MNVNWVIIYLDIFVMVRELNNDYNEGGIKMDIKGFFNKNKTKIKNGLIIIGTGFVGFTIGKYYGAVKSGIIFRESLLSFLNKEDYIKFCDHFDEIHNITTKRG